MASRRPRPAEGARGFGQHTGRLRVVDGGRDDRRPGCPDQRRQVRTARAAEGRAPVHDPRQAAATGVHDETDAVGVQMDHVGRGVRVTFGMPRDGYPAKPRVAVVKLVLSGALAAEVGGSRLSEEQVVMIGAEMIAAGHATTAESLGSAVHRIAADPGVQKHLRANPGTLPTAIEEFLRFDPALHELGRTAAVDVELRGRTIPAGSAVGLNLAAANRDPGAFPDPDTLDPARQLNRHLSFGHGIHKCLGAPLGRLELLVALEELLAATTSIELTGPPENDTGLIGGGFAALHIRVR